MPHIGEKCKVSVTSIDDLNSLVGSRKVVVVKKGEHRGKCCVVIDSSASEYGVIYTLRTHVGWALRSAPGREIVDQFTLEVNEENINELILVVENGI